MVTYKLYRCDPANGLVDVVLHLYRGCDLAFVTTIATAQPRLAVRIYMQARAHLRGLGIQEADGVASGAA